MIHAGMSGQNYFGMRILSSMSMVTATLQRNYGLYWHDHVGVVSEYGARPGTPIPIKSPPLFFPGFKPVRWREERFRRGLSSPVADEGGPPPPPEAETNIFSPPVRHRTPDYRIVALRYGILTPQDESAPTVEEHTFTGIHPLRWRAQPFAIPRLLPTPEETPTPDAETPMPMRVVVWGRRPYRTAIISSAVEEPAAVADTVSPLPRIVWRRGAFRIAANLAAVDEPVAVVVEDTPMYWDPSRTAMAWRAARRWTIPRPRGYPGDESAPPPPPVVGEERVKPPASFKAMRQVTVQPNIFWPEV